MAAIFASFKPLIVALEGETLVNIPGDPRGAVKYGISQHAYPLVDIANLTLDEACAILERDFWNHYSLGLFVFQSIANKVMSMLINDNPYSAILNIQKAVNNCGGDLIEDGLLTVATITAMNLIPEILLLNTVKLVDVAYCMFQVKVNPAQSANLQAWLARALL